MRRKKQRTHTKSCRGRWWRERLNAYWLYKLLSYYGTSYWQATAVLLALLLFFSMVFLYTGLRSDVERIGSPTRVIEYNMIPDTGHQRVKFEQWASDYGEAILFSLSIVTFQRDRFYAPVGWQSQLFLYLAVLTMTAQAALILLSIRRRFRRS